MEILETVLLYRKYREYYTPKERQIIRDQLRKEIQDIKKNNPGF